jgi:hypothetical protein
MKTKITILLILLSISTILLVGCSNAVAATVSSSNGLSTGTRLALGTLKLEGTDQAVTSAQAVELLTLWQGYQSLSNSETTSQVELDALVKQIQGTMTADQIKAIEAMDLNDQSLTDIMATLGGSDDVNTSASTPSTSGLNQAAPLGGPGGMPSDGGGVPMGDVTGGVAVQVTLAATQSISSIQTTQVNPMMVQALIQLLETRTQMTG